MAAEPASAAEDASKPRATLIKLPPRPPVQKGPSSAVELKAMAGQVLEVVSQGQVALMSASLRASYKINEIMMVLASVFENQNQDFEVLVSRYTLQPPVTGEQQPAEGGNPPPTYLRFVVKPAASPAAPPSASVKRMNVSKDTKAIALAFQVVDELQVSSEMQLNAIGPFAIRSMLEAVNRATVRARNVLKKQLVVANVSAEVLEARVNKDGMPDPRGPPTAMSVLLRLRPLEAKA